jgi:hypothetical protein
MGERIGEGRVGGGCEERCEGGLAQDDDDDDGGEHKPCGSVSSAWQRQPFSGYAPGIWLWNLAVSKCISDSAHRV